MCTVTYLPLEKGNFILTSNRDEQPHRETVFPEKYEENEVEMLFPKDKTAGGSWVGIGSKKRMACLLNGAFEIHERQLPYRLSRGVVVKEILKTDGLETHIADFDFNGIEPFTLVIVDWNEGLQLFELVWDGAIVHFKKLAQEPQIWSSSTLYSKEMRQIREKWFTNWLSKNEEFDQKTILQFHHSNEGNDKNTAVLMKRDWIETVSITLVQKKGDEVVMRYEDVISGEISETAFLIQQECNH